MPKGGEGTPIIKRPIDKMRPGTEGGSSTEQFPRSEDEEVEITLENVGSSIPTLLKQFDGIVNFYVRANGEVVDKIPCQVLGGDAQKDSITAAQEMLTRRLEAIKKNGNGRHIFAAKGDDIFTTPNRSYGTSPKEGNA